MVAWSYLLAGPTAKIWPYLDACQIGWLLKVQETVAVFLIEPDWT